MSHQPNPPASQSLLYRLQILCNYYLPIVELEAQRIETRTELQEVLGPERTPTDNNTPEQASSQMIISDSENETDYDPAIGSTASSEHVIEALAGIFHPPPSTQFFIKAENIPRLLALAKQVKFVRLEDMLWSGGIYFTENAKKTWIRIALQVCPKTKILHRFDEEKRCTYCDKQLCRVGEIMPIAICFEILR